MIDMTNAPHEGLLAVNAELVEVAKLVGAAMNLATSALLDADLTIAQQVIQNDDEIDVRTSAVEELCIEIIANDAPTGRDLRIAIGALRIAASLERMGDLARHVAKQARLRYPNTAVPEDLAPTFAHMGRLAEGIINKTAAVITSQDVTLATDIAEDDSEMDRVHRELFTIVLSADWKHGVEAAIDVTLLSRYYERYADHAVSVTKRVVNVVTGEPYAGVMLD
jgi:phosphate transport system protein